MSKSYGIYSKFDVKQHKETFINNLEVIIYPDGLIEYAIPSHQEKLIKIACSMFGWSRDQLNKECPEEYYFDFLTWLCNITGCVSVWNNYIMTGNESMTEEQIKSLEMLKAENVYFGTL